MSFASIGLRLLLFNQNTFQAKELNKYIIDFMYLNNQLLVIIIIYHFMIIIED